MGFEIAATLCTALFAGAALYISVAEHPARMAMGTDLAIVEWRLSYRRAIWMQAPLAVAGMAFALVAWARGDGVAWLVGAILIGAVVPFTVLVTGSTNRALADGGLALDAAAAHLRRWARLHRCEPCWPSWRY
jgi:hypothetical protein